MPTTPMWRCQTVITGAGGSPYYLVGYFDADGGSATFANRDWHGFICGTIGPSAATMPNGWQILTEAEVQRVNPVDGEILAVEAATPYVSVGTASGELLPPANQLLTRWRTGTYVARREVRGHTNIPGIVEPNSGPDGRPINALVNANNTRADGMIASDNSRHVVWSKKNGVWHTTVTASTWTEFAVLRSRRD